LVPRATRQHTRILAHQYGGYRITVASKATLLAVVVALTIDTRTAKWRVDNARSYRPTKPPADHSRCGAPGSRAHLRVLARRRAGMDPAATRGLRTGRDPALPAVHLMKRATGTMRPETLFRRGSCGLQSTAKTTSQTRGSPMLRRLVTER